MGLATVTGLARRGFFAPYRYAATVAPPAGYPELEALFARPEPALRACLAAMCDAAPALAALDGPPPAPRMGQSWFPRLDAAAATVLAAGAARVVEVGSGHSTRFLARAAGAGALTCIDPAPRAALAGLEVDWRREVLERKHLALFRELRSGDIAFFDSSHLLWPGTDVDLILNRILPLLAPGVLVHVHDIFLPDAYPADWAWRGYTEQLGLAGWIAGGAYELVWSSHYALTRMGAAAMPEIAALPLAAGARESSLWLRRTRE